MALRSTSLRSVPLLSVLDGSGGHARDRRSCRHVSGYNRARGNYRPLSNRNTGQDDAVDPDESPPSNPGFKYTLGSASCVCERFVVGENRRARSDRRKILYDDLLGVEVVDNHEIPYLRCERNSRPTEAMERDTKG